MSELKGKCTNRPNIQYIYDVICRIKEEESGGTLEFNHITTLKEEYKNAG